MSHKSLYLTPYKFAKSKQIKWIKSENKNMCYTCDKTYTKLYNTYISDNNNNVSCCKLCIFCHIIKSFKRGNVGDCILCWSDMPQYDIVRKTTEHVVSKSTIPMPYEIDPDAKIININVYVFAKFICQVNNDDRKSFSKYKVFFTNRINRNDINVRNIVLGPYKIEKLSLKYTSLPVYVASKTETHLLNEYFKQIEKSNEKITSIKNTIDAKLQRMF